GGPSRYRAMTFFVAFPSRGAGGTPRLGPLRRAATRADARVLHFVPALSGAARLIQRAYPVAPPTPLPGKGAERRQCGTRLMRHLVERRNEDRPSLYRDVTDKIVRELEAGRLPWVQPWGRAKAALALPQSAGSTRRYSGINILILWGAVIERGFSAQAWLTFR